MYDEKERVRTKAGPMTTALDDLENHFGRHLKILPFPWRTIGSNH